MKIIKQLSILLLVCLLALGLAALLPVPVPASILAMLLLFVALLTGLVKPGHIHEVSSFFVNNMSLFFIPAGVGILNSLQLLQGHWPALLFICVVSTVVTFFAAYGAARAVQLLQQKYKQEGNDG